MDAAVQATDPDQDGTDLPRQPAAEKKALIYAALLEGKYEAAAAVKHLLAQVNNDHASYPTDLVFRIHSDQGGEFVNDELNTYCDERGIHKTTTSGYDPSANSAEPTVGILKRYSRHLLSGARLPSNWWGVATLAAAQLCRAEAGLGEHPQIPFGTRVMVVRDPKPRNAFVPRAEPATVLGSAQVYPMGTGAINMDMLRSAPT